MRPSRRWVHVALAAALVLVATWGLSRTLGSSTQTGGGGDQAPAGEHHQHADEAAAAGHDHGESTVTYEQLPEATRAEVDQVIARWANRYPTAADATRDGWFKATPSLYGIGAHYIRGDAISGGNAFDGAATFDLLNPNILLFHGEGPDARLAGVSYVLADEPEGFTGDHDTWHSHSSVCMQGQGMITLTEEDSPVWFSEPECTAAGGRVLALDNDQMMHLWIGPDYIDEAPIFAHDHPALYDGYRPDS